MDPRIKELWVAMLRSGIVVQGQGALTKVTPEGKTHCCLGVLCELARFAGVLTADDVATYTDVEAETMVQYDGDTYLLPAKVANWAALPFDGIDGEGWPEALGNGVIGQLVTMNDGSSIPYEEGEEILERPHSFDEIADLIEKDL
jgi:hypothetical protein